MGLEPTPAGPGGRQRAPAPGLDDPDDLLHRFRRDHGANLGVACLVPPHARDRPQLAEQAGRSVWTAKANWPGSEQDEQFTPSQYHSI